MFLALKFFGAKNICEKGVHKMLMKLKPAFYYKTRPRVKVTFGEDSREFFMAANLDPNYDDVIHTYSH